MINLAGDKNADQHIARELARSKIELVHGDPQPGEVSASITGRIGEYRFRRAWRYWIVKGLVPLDVARVLYDDPVGVTDVRIAGHCGCPAPGGCETVWFDADGVRLLDFAQKAEAEHFASKPTSILREVGERILAENRFVEVPSAVGRGFVDLYHIDSEVSLRLFADTIRRHLQAGASDA